jgi:hypothetical protein
MNYNNGLKNAPATRMKRRPALMTLILAKPKILSFKIILFMAAMIPLALLSLPAVAQNLNARCTDVLRQSSKPIHKSKFNLDSEASQRETTKGGNFVIIYRGTRHATELQVISESGYVMSDAARIAYLDARFAGASIESALEMARSTSATAHLIQLKVWGSLKEYTQAHGEFGTEIQSFGPRTLISWTTKQKVAEQFAWPNGQVISTTVDKTILVPQTLTSATESEVFILHLHHIEKPEESEPQF